MEHRPGITCMFGRDHQQTPPAFLFTQKKKNTHTENPQMRFCTRIKRKKKYTTTRTPTNKMKNNNNQTHLKQHERHTITMIVFEETTSAPLRIDLDRLLVDAPRCGAHAKHEDGHECGHALRRQLLRAAADVERLGEHVRRQPVVLPRHAQPLLQAADLAQLRGGLAPVRVERDAARDGHDDAQKGRRVEPLVVGRRCVPVGGRGQHALQLLRQAGRLPVREPLAARALLPHLRRLVHVREDGAHERVRHDARDADVDGAHHLAEQGRARGRRDDGGRRRVRLQRRLQPRRRAGVLVLLHERLGRRVAHPHVHVAHRRGGQHRPHAERELRRGRLQRRRRRHLRVLRRQEVERVREDAARVGRDHAADALQHRLGAVGAAQLHRREAAVAAHEPQQVVCADLVHPVAPQRERAEQAVLAEERAEVRAGAVAQPVVVRQQRRHARRVGERGEQRRGRVLAEQHALQVHRAVRAPAHRVRVLRLGPALVAEQRRDLALVGEPLAVAAREEESVVLVERAHRHAAVRCGGLSRELHREAGRRPRLRARRAVELVRLQRRGGLLRQVHHAHQHVHGEARVRLRDVLVYRLGARRLLEERVRHVDAHDGAEVHLGLQAQRAHVDRLGAHRAGLARATHQLDLECQRGRHARVLAPLHLLHPLLVVGVHLPHLGRVRRRVLRELQKHRQVQVARRAVRRRRQLGIDVEGRRRGRHAKGLLHARVRRPHPRAELQPPVHIPQLRQHHVAAGGGAHHRGREGPEEEHLPLVVHGTAAQYRWCRSMMSLLRYTRPMRVGDTMGGRKEKGKQQATNKSETNTCAYMQAERERERENDCICSFVFRFFFLPIDLL
ncbi:hypothetical protein STCU_06248 [Strigomonas culicis]|uniref:Uncharacterized protein n=1 Tax=Strigomonas culicis TaxID=28005 RepID=S9VSR3_9TRYP|nr:hypothetical protein STCU_06248 [Strigomonas culicis]|eukprot:EPY26245.1 hypothetical protein STCU_06248 [Strigomonas culicis]